MMYDEAGSLRALARNLGVSHATAAKWLRGVGLVIRNSRPRTIPPKQPTIAEREAWQKLYDEAGSVIALARKLGKSGGTISYHLRVHGIEIRRTGYAFTRSETARGADHHNWKGGTYYHAGGYIYEYAPEHPDAPKAKGYVLQHRLVVERKLNR